MSYIAGEEKLPITNDASADNNSYARKNQRWEPATGAIGTFRAGYDYIAGDPIVYDSKLWQAAHNFHSGPSFNSADWEIIGVINYNDLINKPAIDGTALDQSSTAEELGLETLEGSAGKVAKQSDTTQVINSDIAMGAGKKILGEESAAGPQHELAGIGVYGTYIQNELANETNPTCINHNAKATDGTVVGKNVIVNYKDENGVERSDAFSYVSDLTAETNARMEYDHQQDLKLQVLNGQYNPLEPYDFGKALDVITPNPTDVSLLTTYAITMTPDATTPADILDGTVIKNLFDGHEFVWNATAQQWLDWGIGNIVIAGNGTLGVTMGTQDPGDGTQNDKILVLPNGQMRLIGYADIMAAIAAAGKVSTVNGIAANTDKEVTIDYFLPDESWTDPDGENYDTPFPGGTFTVNGVQVTFPAAPKISDIPVNANVGYFNEYQTTDPDLPDILIADVILNDFACPANSGVWPTVQSKTGTLAPYISDGFVITVPYDCVLNINSPMMVTNPTSMKVINNMFFKRSSANADISRHYFTVDKERQSGSVAISFNMRQGEKLAFAIWTNVATNFYWKKWENSTEADNAYYGHWDISIQRIK